MYFLGQSLHGTQYTTPFFPRKSRKVLCTVYHAMVVPRSILVHPLSPGELAHPAHHGHTEPREGNSVYSVHCTVRLIVMQQTYIVLINKMLSVITTNRIYSPFKILI